MCNLYNVTTAQQAIIEWARAMRDHAGNVPPTIDVYPNYPAPVVRNAPDGVRAWRPKGEGRTAGFRAVRLSDHGTERVVRPDHQKAMPVILTTHDDVETWLTAPAEEALHLQRPLPDNAPRIIAAVRSRHENALPLIMTHGSPGSVIELLETVGPLTDPTSHGGTPEDPFHLVLPSLPGYGFSGEPTELGWEFGRIARAWAELMNRLGYTRYVAQGGDVGANVTDAMGRQGPEGLLGIHVNLLSGAFALKDRLPAVSEQERAALKALKTFTTDGFGYFLEQSTRPQTIGYSLLDSPVGLAAWMLDHDTDSYYKISRAFVDGEPVGSLTRDSIVDNITLYWLTGTGGSAARWYWEFGRFLAKAREAGEAPPAVSVPVAFTTFPGEIWAAPRSWVETVYPGLAYFNEVDRGGHFAAWEEPQLFTAEVRAAFRSLRQAQRDRATAQ